MNEWVEIFNDYARIINVTLTVLLMGIVIHIFRAIIVQKDAAFKVLEERFKNVEIFTVDKVAEKFRALKEIYEIHLGNWYDTSLKHLEEENRKAIESKENDFQLRIEEEIAKRKSLMKEYAEQKDTALETMPQWSRAQVCGTYAVVGQNPRTPQLSYFGELQIKERDEVLWGTWEIGAREIGASKQSNEGTGLLVGNALAFRYKHTDPQDPYAGVVLYEIMSDDVMRGRWTVFGESNVGFEECRKKKPDE